MGQNSRNLAFFSHNFGFDLPRYQIEALAKALEECGVKVASVGFLKLAVYRSENHVRSLRFAPNEGLWFWATWDMVSACYRANGQWGSVASRNLMGLATWGVRSFRSPADAIMAEFG